METETTVGRAIAPMPNGPRERIGDAIGHWLAPAVERLSRFRRARPIHKSGVAFVGKSEAIIGGAYANLGAQLEGRVLARCSSALFERSERFDVLGIALRFRPGHGPALDEQAVLGDQDLLFATVRSPLTLLGALFATNAGDYMGNRYYGVAPFAAHDHHRIELRLEPLDPVKLEGARDDKLREAVRAGHVVLWLEARKTLTLGWHAVARITFEREVELDEHALHFDPERSGAGIVPVGLVHAIRRATYVAAQTAR